MNKANKENRSNSQEPLLSNSSSEDLSNKFGFLTPPRRNKRTHSAALLPQSPVSSPRFLTKSKFVEVVADESEFNELLTRLRRVEHNLIYAHRIYNNHIESPTSYLVALIGNDCYENITARARGVVPPPLPCVNKINKSMQTISTIFGVAESDPKPHTYKQTVYKFATSVWDLMLATTLKIFDFQQNQQAFSITVLNDFFNEFQAKLNFTDQINFVTARVNLPVLLQACIEHPELYLFCLNETLENHWRHLLKDLHREVKRFLYMHYCDEEYADLDKVMSFEVILWIYEFHTDLSHVYNILRKLLEANLPTQPIANLDEALRYMVDTGHATREKEKNIPSYLQYVQNFTEEERKCFLESKEYENKAKSEKLQSHIDKKSFSRLMRTLFQNYIKLYKKYYQFCNLTMLGMAEKYVITTLESLNHFNNSTLLTNYRIAADYLHKQMSSFNLIHKKFDHALKIFFNDLHDFSQIPCINDIGQAFYELMSGFKPNTENPFSWFAQKFDEDWLLLSLNQLSLNDNGSLTDPEQLLALQTKLTDLYKNMQIVWQECDNLISKIIEAKQKIAMLQGDVTPEDQLMQVGLISMQEKFSKLFHSAETLQSKIYIKDDASRDTQNCILTKISLAFQSVKSRELSSDGNSKSL